VNTRAPTVGRLAAMVVFALSCFGLLLMLWLSFGGATPLKPKGYRIEVPFREAAQLGTQADVRIAGVPIGKVVSKRVPEDRPDVVMATLEIDEEFAPLRADARAVLREKTLVGETYVEMTPGTRGAPMVPEGGALGEAQIQAPVRLDDILETFDPYTRSAFRTWQQSLGESLLGRGTDLNDAVGSLPGFVTTTGDLVEELDRNREALRGLVRNTGVVFEALTADERQLGRLITGSEGTFRAIARRREAFAEMWQIFPTFLRESRATATTLEGFSTRATPVLRELAPATDDLAAALRDLGRAAPDLGRFLRGLDPLAAATREGLPASTELLRGMRPLVQALEPYLGELNPTLDWIGHHSLTLTDMLANLGVATTAKTTSRDPRAAGHYLRQFGPTGLESLGGASTRLPGNRGNTYFNPLSLTGREQSESGTAAAWDCRNAGNPPSAPCRTEPPYRFQGELRKYPHVQFEDYRTGRPVPKPGR
jgi:phospholipid/cholesterol/gamma-HCH transport system substrate-binding protein